MSKEEFRMIPSGTKVWSISLQENVVFDKDIPVRITNSIIGNDEYVFGKLQLLLFEHLIPGVTDKANGEVGFNLKDTTPWKVPEPKIPNFNYNKDE